MNELSIFARAMVQERRDVVITIMTGFIAGIAGVTLFSLSGYLISKTVFLPPLYTLILLAALVKLLGLVRAASRYGERLYSHRATFSLLSRLRTTFFAKLIPLSPQWLGRQRSGELLAKIVGDVESLQFYFLRVAYPPLIVISVFLTTVAVTSFISVWIALVFVVGMIIIAFGVPAIVRRSQHKQTDAVHQLCAALATDSAEMMYGFIDLKLYGRLAAQEQHIEQIADELAAAQQQAATRLLRGQSLHSFMTFFISWLVLLVGAILIMHGSMNGLFLAMLIMTAMTVFDEAAAMATLPAYQKDSEYAAKRLHTVLSDMKLTKRASASKQLQRHQPVRIDIEDVSFRYDEDWRWTLQHISLHIPAGSKTAIVGASGSGKTSLLELLLKLHPLEQGQICMNTIPLEQLNEESIWSNARVLLQRNQFFNGTVRDNLLLEQDGIPDTHLLALLDQVQLSHKKLDDPILEKGENLSDGEKQRLALVRILLRSGSLWLLDEPTSALDYATEQRVLELLFQQAQGDTVIMVSHRLTGLEQMDQIIVMDQGRIAEAGSYDELMQRGSYLYQLKQLELEMIG
ncbi:thiol reductant ABC exporter subunit CydC [Paenibacillus campi]|uniref:thiol reductant ABC exporter subunit CydC n=1 Tax=Paenibacillus campi TaxID=3106031 RepID=UPI002B0016DC|nr:thiol reductant ABC exporter subunit CydC [Paenibacillus sp. SGZ-1009]